MSTRGTRGWSVSDLRRRLCNSLLVARRAVELVGREGYRDSANGAEVSPEKLISETAILLAVTKPVTLGDPALFEAHDQLACTLIPHARSSRMRAAICLRPNHARELGFAHSCLSRLGHTDSDFEQLLVASLGAEESSSSERPPHREMEQEWIQRFLDSSSAADAHVRRRSMLGRPMDALASTKDDVYAFTHALMYATDFGLRRPRLPRGRSAIAADAEVALAWSLDDHDYDLTGELLMTWPLLRLRWSPAAVFAFTVLAAVEDQAGFLPPPSLSLDHFRSLPATERPAFALASAYHTAYVVGLLTAVILSQGRVPPRAVPTDTRSARAAQEILEFIPTDARGNEPHWHAALRDLDDDQRDAIAPLLLALCLRRAVRERDLERIRAVLQLASSHDLLAAPAPRQALGLLQRATRLVSLTAEAEHESVSANRQSTA